MSEEALDSLVRALTAVLLGSLVLGGVVVIGALLLLLFLATL